MHDSKYRRLVIAIIMALAALTLGNFVWAEEEEAAPSCQEFMSYNIHQRLGFVRDFDIGDDSERGRAEATALEEFCTANPDANTADIRGGQKEE